MQLNILSLLPSSTYLPSSWICYDWQTLAMTKCPEGFVWRFVDWNTLAMTTLVERLRALEWLLHSWVFPNSSLWQLSGWAVPNRFYRRAPGGHLDNSRKPSCMWPLSYSFRNEWLAYMSFSKTTGPGNPTEVGVSMCPSWRKRSYGAKTETESEVVGCDPQAKPIKSALQMCLFGSNGVSFLVAKLQKRGIFISKSLDISLVLKS